MAHTPEHTDLFVCTNCQVVSAGTVVRDDEGDHHFEEPPRCGACGESAFVEMSMYPHHRE